MRYLLFVSRHPKCFPISLITTLMNRSRDLHANNKNVGERGSPCLIPRERRNTSEGLPLMIIEVEVEVMQFMIRLVDFSSSPN